MKTIYTINEDANQLIAERRFKANKHKVWTYYTSAELLDLWWAPAPYKAVTKEFEFRDGGHWHYVMQGPEGDAHYCINLYSEIHPEDSFKAKDAFAHEDWTINTDMPQSDWEVSFTEEAGETLVRVVLTTASVEGLNTLVEMGMKEGFDQGLSQLEALLTE